MAINWKELLTDAAKYPDTLVLKVNGEDVTLKDLRDYDKQTNGEAAQRLAAIEQREGNTNRAADRLVGIIENVARITGFKPEEIISGDPAALQAQMAVRMAARKEGITVNAAGEIDWAKDPIYAPVDARFKPLEANVNGAVQALKASVGVYGNDRPRYDWLEFKLDNPELAKNLKYADVVAHAVKQGYKDEIGFVDIKRALTDMTQPALAEKAKTAEFERGKREGEAAARAAMMGATGQPGAGGVAGIEFQTNPDGGAGASGGRVKSIAETLQAAMNDPDIMRTQQVQ